MVLGLGVLLLRLLLPLYFRCNSTLFLLDFEYTYRNTLLPPCLPRKASTQYLNVSSISSINLCISSFSSQENLSVLYTLEENFVAGPRSSHALLYNASLHGSFFMKNARLGGTQPDFKKAMCFNASALHRLQFALQTPCSHDGVGKHSYAFYRKRSSWHDCLPQASLHGLNTNEKPVQPPTPPIPLPRCATQCWHDSLREDLYVLSRKCAWWHGFLH